MKRLPPWPVLGVALVFPLACSTLGPPLPSPTASLSPSPTRTSTAAVAPVAAQTATSTPSHILSNPQVIVLANDLPGPDDLVLAPDGSIYISDVLEGTVRRYTPPGGLQLILSGLNEPEGMVFLPGGSLVIAEQGRNRLVRYEPGTQMLEPFFDLRSTTAQPGVDGLAWDASSQTIIVPDRPNGTVLRLSLDARTVTQLASGFARPTGAWVEPNGSLLVADENGNSVSRIHPDGRVEKLADLPIPDDVIEDAAGNIFVITLGDNAVHLISGLTGRDMLLADGMIDPQGIIFDADGNLVVTDSGNHRPIELVIH